MLDPVFILALVFLGLLLGSFLNVVIYRLPQTKEAEVRSNTPYSLWYLAWPMSFCPHCQTPIKPYHNIPLFSFLLLFGKSSCCGQPIGWRYPLVELCGAVIVLAAWWHYDNLVDGVLVTVFLSVLMVAAVIDWQRFYLFDILTLPLLWLGLVANIDARFVLLPDAVAGAAGGYVVLALLTGVFSFFIKKRAMGNGDFKLLAALGAWLGWQPLPILVFIAAVLGLLLGAGRYLVRRRGRHLPFGPCLAAAGVVMLFWGDELMLAYWNMVRG